MKWTIRNIHNEKMYEVEADSFLKAVKKISTNLRSADLSYADLRSANLSSANLSYANLSSADLSYAKTKLSELLKTNSVASLLQLYWGNLPADLCLEMMRHDAESCGIEAMNQWVKTGECPFANSVRDYFFIENKSLWEEGKPKLRGIELLKALWIAKDGKL